MPLENAFVNFVFCLGVKKNFFGKSLDWNSFLFIFSIAPDLGMI